MFLKLSKTRVTLYLGLLWQSLPKCQRVWCFCQDSVVCTLLPFPPPRPCSSPKQEQDPAPQMSHLLHEMTDTGRWGGKLVGRSLNTEEDYMLTCISISSAAIMLKQEPFCLRKSNRISKHFKSSEEHLSRWFSVEKANLEASLKQLSVTENKTTQTLPIPISQVLNSIKALVHFKDLRKCCWPGIVRVLFQAEGFKL